MRPNRLWLPLAALPLLLSAATQGDTVIAAPALPAAPALARQEHLAGDILLGFIRNGGISQESRQAIVTRLDNGQVAAPNDDKLFLWALAQPDAFAALPRFSFKAGERLQGWGLFHHRATQPGGLELAMNGKALIALFAPDEAPVAWMHDFSGAPLLILPVTAGGDLFILPLKQGDAPLAGMPLPSPGVSGFNPLFPYELVALSAEPMSTDGRGHARAAVIHVETAGERGIARFELQRSLRPDGGWRTIAAAPATGGGDYHLIDSRFPGRAYYRLVPVLQNGLRAAPSALLAAGPSAAH